MAWFKKTRKPIALDDGKTSRVPEGLWVKCPGCSQIIYNKDLATNLNVCPKCAITSASAPSSGCARSSTTGSGSSTTRGWSRPTRCSSPTRSRTRTRLKAWIASTGLKDAVIVASGPIDGIETVVAAMEYGFIGGSMGVVVGEKIARGIERAIDERRPSSSSAARAARG